MAILAEVKKRLQITSSYQDEMLESLIDTTKVYLVNAGADEEAVEDETAYGVIATGVYDLWTRASFSNLFKDMAIQFVLANPNEEEEEDEDGNEEGSTGDTTIMVNCDCEPATDEEVVSLFQEGENG